MTVRQKCIDFTLLVLSLGIVFLAPINTTISLSHFAAMTSALTMALCIPYLYYRKYEPGVIAYPVNIHVLLRKRNLAFVGLAAIISYFLLPFYFANTGAYYNWPNATSSQEIMLLFIGTNALGLWDELFFINTVLTILKRHFRFWVANSIQALFFTIFLYELGFTHWLPLIIYPFALLQGYMLRTYKSLAFVVAIHLTIDFILFLALLNAYGNLPFKLFLQ